MLSQLIVITWESAVPPCACAIAALVVCIQGVRVVPVLPTSNLRSRHDLSHIHSRALLSLTGPLCYKPSSESCTLFRCSRPCTFFSESLFFVALPTHQFVSLAPTREGRAKLADAANHTHFPTLTNTSRLDRRWSLSGPRDECDNTDPTTQGSRLPVHVCHPRLSSLFFSRGLTCASSTFSYRLSRAK